MSISIVINADTAEQARHEMRQLLGTTNVIMGWDNAAAEQPQTAESQVKNDAGQRENTVDAVAVSEVPTTFTQRIQGVRERGKASPGHTRRTKAEIAEDEAAITIASMTTLPADATAAQVAEAFAGVVADAAAISTGDERVGPEDDAETVAQDEADETAETAAAVEERPADKKLTHDDVRHALAAYLKLFGMDACQQDGPKVITLVCGEGKVKMSDIPDDQTVLAKVVAGIAEMTAKNPFSRTKVA